MQLTVGPTALISLLTGTIISKYCPNYANDPMSALDTAAQAAFCCGIIITVMGILNLGSLINFMSHPVMSGFTTGAALTIGLGQMKGAFGMMVSPAQVGDGDTEYNYQVVKWWIQNFNTKDESGYYIRNPYAIQVINIT